MAEYRSESGEEVFDFALRNHESNGDITGAGVKEERHCKQISEKESGLQARVHDNKRKIVELPNEIDHVTSNNQKLEEQMLNQNEQTTSALSTETVLEELVQETQDLPENITKTQCLLIQGNGKVSERTEQIKKVLINSEKKENENKNHKEEIHVGIRPKIHDPTVPEQSLQNLVSKVTDTASMSTDSASLQEGEVSHCPGKEDDTMQAIRAFSPTTNSTSDKGEDFPCCEITTDRSHSITDCNPGDVSAASKEGTREIAVLHMFDFNKTYDNVKFANVGTTDYYRKSWPYKIFSHPGHSKVDISFELNEEDNFYIGDVIMGLNHCATNCYAVVDMYINKKPFHLTYKDANPFKFGEQTFHIERELCVLGKNIFTIVLGRSSPGVYWLSDASVAIEKIYV